MSSPFILEARHQHPGAAHPSFHHEPPTQDRGESLDSSSTRARSLMNSVVKPFLTCVNHAAGNSSPPTSCMDNTAGSNSSSSSSWATPMHVRTTTPTTTQAKFATPSPPHAFRSNSGALPTAAKSRPVPSPFSASHPLVHTPSSSPFWRNHAKMPTPSSSHSAQQNSQNVSTDGPIQQVTENDILCGRGGGSGCSHIGNTRFRELVASQRALYNTLTKKQKMMLSRQIVNLIRSVGGRFLARDPANGAAGGSKGLSPTGKHQWYDIGLARSVEKTAQALREKPKSTNNEPGNEENNVDSSSECNSDITVKQNNVTSPKAKGKSGKANTTPPKLVVPSHLRDIYGSAPPTGVEPSTSNHSDKMPVPQRPFFRSAPHPMPCHDFHYRRQPSPIIPPSSVQPTPPVRTAIHFQDEWHQQQPTQIHTLRPPSSSRNQSDSALFLADHSSHSFGSLGHSPSYGMAFENAAAQSPPASDSEDSPARSPIMKRARVGTTPEGTPNESRGARIIPDSDHGEMMETSSLSMEQRVIRAPRSPPHDGEQLVPPSQVTGHSDDQDGLAALSTAAFLRLDEEFGM